MNQLLVQAYFSICSIAGSIIQLFFYRYSSSNANFPLKRFVSFSASSVLICSRRFFFVVMNKSSSVSSIKSLPQDYAICFLDSAFAFASSRLFIGLFSRAVDNVCSNIASASLLAIRSFLYIFTVFL